MANENNALSAAKRNKQDEFYTQLVDVEEELRHYRKHFKGKVVYCNCDDPYVSAFSEYFTKNFAFLGLKKLITTCYKSQRLDLFSEVDSEQAIKLEYTGGAANNLPTLDDIGVTALEGDGDFRSEECVEILNEADIVVTNPPFSLFREHISQLIEHNMEFIVLGNQGAITYKEVFPLIKENKLWLGVKNGDMSFKVPEHYESRATRYWQDESGQKWRSFGNMCWYTNLDHKRRHEEVILVQQYYGNEDSYLNYDNYEAIEISKIQNIPSDYDGVMGVPITFLNKYNPDQFEIVGIAKSWCGLANKTYPKQVQVSKSGDHKDVSKLNDAPAIRLDAAPIDKTYYIVDNNYYVATYVRILVRKI
jgi:hypothetical protein